MEKIKVIWKGTRNHQIQVKIKNKVINFVMQPGENEVNTVLWEIMKAKCEKYLSDGKMEVVDKEPDKEPEQDKELANEREEEDAID